MDFENQWKSVTNENREIKASSDQRIWNGLERKIKFRRNSRKFIAVAAVLLPLFVVTGLFFTNNNHSSFSQKEMVFKTSHERIYFI